MKQNRILIVDDNFRNTAIIKKVLDNRYQVADAADGETGLEMAASFRPDIVLLDVMLPGIDGYEVCRRMKEDANLANTKIIMVTARAMIGEKLRGYTVGADDYITKPFDGEELRAKVEVYLRLKTVEEHEQLKTDLLTLVGHETRTPLTYAMVAAESLIDTDGLDENQRKLAEMVYDGTSRIAALITKALRYGELTSRRTPMSFSQRDIVAAVEGVISAVSKDANDKGVTIHRRGAESVHTMVDEATFSEAVATIIGNAIKHSPAGGSIYVDIGEKPEHVLVSVIDGGSGISQDELSGLTSGFRTNDVAHHSRGHGLSLAIARAILEAHDGALEAVSQPGCGATFHLRLPLRECTRIAESRTRQ